MALTVQEWELLSFFEVEPQFLDKDIPWEYNSALYKVSAGRFQVRCTIAPAYPDFCLTILDCDQIFFEITALGVQDIRYSKQDGVESLEILVREKHKIRLIIRPTLRIEDEIGHDS